MNLESPPLSFSLSTHSSSLVFWAKSLKLKGSTLPTLGVQHIPYIGNLFPPLLFSTPSIPEPLMPSRILLIYVFFENKGGEGWSPIKTGGFKGGTKYGLSVGTRVGEAKSSILELIRKHDPIMYQGR